MPMRQVLLLLCCPLLWCCSTASTPLSQPVSQPFSQTASPTASQTASEPASQPFAFAVWVHGNASRTDADWQTKLKRLKSAGISDLFIGAGAEELRRMVQLGSKLGLRIHGWVWTVNRPGDKVAMHHPDWYAVNRNNKNSLESPAYVKYYQWLSPFSPGARQHIKDKIAQIAEVKGLASVHLDYVRYCDVILATGLQPKYNLVQLREMPQFDYGYHPEARRRFKNQFGVDPLTMKNPQLSHEWRQFRLNAITDLVSELSQIVHGQGGKISAAVFPFPEMSRQMVRQDWDKWPLDLFLPMIYHNFYEKGLNWIEFCTVQGVRDLKGRAALFSGLYLPALSATELMDAVRRCHKQGANGVSLFSLGALTEEHLRCIEQLSQEFGT